MTYEERRMYVCNKCILHKTCGFVVRNMDNKCPYLDDIMLGWELGQQDTINEVEKALSMDNPCDTCSAIVGIIEQLKKG